MKARGAKVDTDIMKDKSISNFVCNLTRGDHHHNLDSITNNLYTNQKPFWSWIKRRSSSYPGLTPPWRCSYLCSLQCQSLQLVFHLSVQSRRYCLSEGPMEHYQPRETLYLYSLKGKRYTMLSTGSTQLNPVDSL